MVAASANATPPRLPDTAEWPGSGDRVRQEIMVETAFSRIKTINHGRLTSRTFGSQHNEIAVHIKIANRNMLIARPMSERVR